jgi:flagellar basal body rod protein FlgG
MRTRLEELDRLAFDLANVSTAGYKTERGAKRAAERDEFAAELDSAVDVMSSGTRIDMRPGLIATTKRDLDAAIEGPGFFEIETSAGLRYTRNGSFHRRSDGVLTTVEGDPVMGDGGPITVGTGPITIAPDGTIRAGDTTAGRVRVVTFAAEGDLIRESGTRFRALTGAQPEETDARVVGGALEQSNVSVVDRMAQLTELTRAFEALQRGVTVMMNDLDSRVISELGRR